MEPCGFDRGGNTYYILDDNRLYRRTPWILDADDTQPVKKVKGASRRKAPKRRRVEDEMAEEVVAELGAWSCVCVTLHDWTVFVNGLESSKDLDERALRGYLKEDVLPELTRGWMEKEKERQLQDAVANRKRSSRLDEKIARQRAEEEREAAVKRDVEMVKAARQDQMEVERQEKVCCVGFYPRVLFYGSC